MRTRNSFFFSAVISILLAGCGSADSSDTTNNEKVQHSFSITNLADTEYPDNPDIGFRSANYKNDYFSTGMMVPVNGAFNFDLHFYAKTADTITFENIDLSEFIPTIPSALKEDHYLSYISCINQEWNRNQVKFVTGEFLSTNPSITRVDIARNCLNSYLWEIILYVDENGSTTPYAHGWFDFPHDQYSSLFDQKNGISFTEFKGGMENWVDPESKWIDLEKLRTVKDSLPITYSDASDAMYPLAGARKKKYKEIIYPDTFVTMRDLQTDSALFATFTPPGFYNRKDPRTTQLGRLYSLVGVELNEVESKISDQTLKEITFHFDHRRNLGRTSLVIGGVDFEKFPVLSEEDANSGWKSSMGIGNHTFYEDYEEQLSSKTDKSAYYAMLLDGEGKWLDSHTIGIDGPIIHFSDESRSVLHVWLLSFERHALVGHYIINLQST